MPCQDAYCFESHLIVYSGLMTAARLKALNVESVVIDRNAEIGDNWTHRYDCLKFHVPTSNCEMPYSCKLPSYYSDHDSRRVTYSCCLDYKKELQSPNRLNKYDVAEHLRQYVTNFHLNVILSTTILSSSYNPSKKKWTIKLKATDGNQGKTIISKHFVQATGIGSQKPYLPPIEDEHLFKGLSLHSTHYTNARSLSEQGIKVSNIIA